jgi:hypothetical protein
VHRPRPEPKIGGSFAELCKEELSQDEESSAIARLVSAGVTRLQVVCPTGGPLGPLIEVTTAKVAREQRAFLAAGVGQLTSIEEIEWSASDRTAFKSALERTIDSLQRFDKVARFRFATTDMHLAASAADALVDAREHDGPARLFDRVLETGMIVTYSRPYLDSNVAGVGARWRPDDPTDRELHEEIIELRHEYHAHMDHSTQRHFEAKQIRAERRLARLGQCSGMTPDGFAGLTGLRRRYQTRGISRFLPSA